MGKFIAQEVLGMIYKMITDMASKDLVKQLSSIAFECKALHTRLRAVRNQAVSARKDAREIYFDELGVISIYESRRFAASADWRTLKINERENISQKLWCFYECGGRVLQR